MGIHRAGMVSKICNLEIDFHSSLLGYHKPHPCCQQNPHEAGFCGFEGFHSYVRRSCGAALRWVSETRKFGIKSSIRVKLSL